MTEKSEKIFLSEEDRKEVGELYHTVETTRTFPDPAQMALYELKFKLEELGKKYSFDPEKVKGIVQETGEVLL